MYLSRANTACVTALEAVFTDTYRNPDFRSVPVSIDYPLEPQGYPSIWVSYDDRDAVQIISIDHTEHYSDDPGNLDLRPVTRWSFAGSFTLTAVALTSLERNNLYDELVRTFAFGRIEADPSPFRTGIENNDFVAMNVNWDEFRPSPGSASQGTPWGTEDEIIYEKSLTFDVEGEFVSDPVTGDLVLLSAIIATGTQSDHPENTDTIGVGQWV